MAVVSGISHAALIVTDLERAKKLYVDVLGLKELPRPPEIAARIPGAWLACESGAQVHLISDPAASNVGAGPGMYRPHLALHVDDIEAAAAALENAGVPFRRGEVAGARTATFSDPDGNSIELTTL